MKALDIFLIPGECALGWVCFFFQFPANEIEPGLYTAFAFLLALVIWSFLLRITIEVVKKILGFGRGRY